MSIEVTLTAGEVWIIRDLLAAESYRLTIKRSELEGNRLHEFQIGIIESNHSLISSALTKIFNAKGDAKDKANALA